MGQFFTNLKRDKVHLEIYLDGKLLTIIKVSDQNRGRSSSLVFDTENQDVKFKIIKDKSEQLSDDYFNKEEFNR